MSAIPSMIGHARLQETASGLCVVIPARSNWYSLLYYPLLGTAIVASPGFRSLAGSSAFLAIWFGGLLAVTVVRRWLWALMGREVIVVDKSSLSVHYEIAGIGWPRTYMLCGISNMRYVTPVSFLALGVLENRTIRFDYSARTDKSVSQRMGLYFNSSETQQLVAVLQSYTSLALASSRREAPPGGPAAAVPSQ